MIDETIKEGALHEIPEDILSVLKADANLRDNWNKLTPLARNEWICWTTIVKKEETRISHVQRLQSAILNGKKRPCCWPGCPHRNTKSKKYLKA